MAFDDFAVQVGDDQIGGGEGGVVNSAGLDDDEWLRSRAIDTAGIAKGMRGKAAAEISWLA